MIFWQFWYHVLVEVFKDINFLSTLCATLHIVLNVMFISYCGCHRYLDVENKLRSYFYSSQCDDSCRISYKAGDIHYIQMDILKWVFWYIARLFDQELSKMGHIFLDRPCLEMCEINNFINKSCFPNSLF